MPYNTKFLKTDQRTWPAPQYFNPTTDDYEALLGSNGASRVLIYDANGNPLFVAGNPGQVSVTNFPATQNVQVASALPAGSNKIGSVDAQLTGSKVQIDTLVNAASISAGGNVNISLSTTDESEIWLLFTVDQKPWTVFAGSTWVHTQTSAINSIYPTRLSVNETFSDLNFPAKSLVIGTFDDPSNLLEAKEYMLPASALNGTTIFLINESASVATVTIRAMRIWRKAR